MSIKLNCANCESEIYRVQSEFNRSKTKVFFCNKECKAEYQRGKSLSDETKRKISSSVSGENNPNFGNKWSNEKREQHSENIKNNYIINPELRIISGSANRGKKFSKERIEKMHGHRTFESYSHPHTEEQKKLISERSKLLWENEEFRRNIRSAMEIAGHWVPEEHLSEYERYFRKSNWFKKFDKFLRYVPETNIKCLYIKDDRIVRDHYVPRKFAFRYNINYEIIRHPCNCRVISNKENITKGFDDDKTSDDVLLERLEELKIDIINFDNSMYKYKFHDKTLKLIKENKIYG